MAAAFSSSISAIRVLVDTPAKQGLFDYALPAEFAEKACPGQMVVVPFNHQVHQGLVWECGVTPETDKLKEVLDIVDEIPVLTAAQLALAAKIAERSLCPLAEAVKLLMNDKIRKISAFEYCLNGAPEESPQNAFIFSPQEADRGILRQQVITLFHEHGNRLSESELNDSFERSLWKPVVDRLIKQKLVTRETVFRLPPDRAKKVPAAALEGAYAPDASVRFSRIREVHERREKVLLFLNEQPERTAFVSRILSETGANAADLKELEKAGFIRRTEIEQWRDHQHYMQELSQSAVALTAEQAEAVASITAGISASGKNGPVLLHGVTGSGKTEVYLRSAAEALRLGKQVLVLVPEIALTPQILSRFENRFPGLTGVCHSNLNPGERYDTWRRARSGQYRIIVGPRSALSMPLPELGLIIVDECHEDSYYQTNERPYFSAVRAAADYAEICGAQLVLGSATPTAAQMFKAEHSHWQIVRMKNRATGAAHPRVDLVDMRQELKAGNSEIFSRRLLSEIQKSLDLGKQVILFLNRRGSYSYSFCHTCGYTFECPNCDVPYSWHESANRFVCHFCGSTIQKPEVCPQCGGSEIRQFGAGVETAEKLIREKFPSARVIRMDSDTSEGNGRREALLSCFARHEADILIGTQMIAKGLDFPEVRLAGVILADVGSNFHDYRVDEHSFQMLTQVAGRAGRSGDQGLALIQTFQPERYSIRAAALGDYERFYENEISYRRMMGYPPFSRLLRLEIREKDPLHAESTARGIASALKQNMARMKVRTVRLIGPAPCYFPRIRDEYRWHIILRGPDPLSILNGIDLSRCRVEVDPPSLL